MFILRANTEHRLGYSGLALLVWSWWGGKMGCGCVGRGIAQDVRLCGDRRRLLGALLWVGSLSGAFDFWDVVFYNMNHLNQRSEP